MTNTLTSLDVHEVQDDDITEEINLVEHQRCCWCGRPYIAPNLARFCSTPCLDADEDARERVRLQDEKQAERVLRDTRRVEQSFEGVLSDAPPQRPGKKYGLKYHLTKTKRY